MFVFVHMSLNVCREMKRLDSDASKRTSLSAINRLPHTRQNFSEFLLELFIARAEPDPLHRPGSPHIASPHDLVDEPPRLTVRVKRPSLTAGASARGSAHTVDVRGQGARNVVLQDVCDAASRKRIQTAAGAIGGDRNDGVGGLRGAVGGVVGRFGESGDKF
jgi:hypothetical protein